MVVDWPDVWVRSGQLRSRPATSLDDIYAQHLESPGTEAYSPAAAKALCRQAGLELPVIRIQLKHGHLLEGAMGQRYEGMMFSVAKALWPRWFFRRLTPFLGLYLLIEARKV